MAFKVLTDASANIPGRVLKQYGIDIIPFTFIYDGVEHICPDVEEFDGKEYYAKLRKGLVVTTAQVNPQKYMDFFEPYLQQGFDIICACMAGGISGSFASANIAAEEMMEKYPERKIACLDSMTASLGQAMPAFKACELRDKGVEFDEAVAYLTEYIKRVCSVFTVDDLMCLKRGGRLSNLGAVAGIILQIKPILKGSEIGKIVCTDKVRGRKRAIENLADKYEKRVVDAENQIVYIAHADCREDAEKLAAMIRERKEPKDIMIVDYEPVTGSHVGPAALALFFESYDGVRAE